MKPGPTHLIPKLTRIFLNFFTMQSPSIKQRLLKSYTTEYEGLSCKTSYVHFVSSEKKHLSLHVATRFDKHFRLAYRKSINVSNPQHVCKLLVKLKLTYTVWESSCRKWVGISELPLLGPVQKKTTILKAIFSLSISKLIHHNSEFRLKIEY